MRRKENDREITEEDIALFKFRDICGTISKAELKILKSRGIQTFTGGTIDASKHFPVSSGRDKKRLKKWIKLLEDRKKAGDWI